MMSLLVVIKWIIIIKSVIIACLFIDDDSYRLKQELQSLAADKCQRYHTSLSALKYSFHSPPTKPNIAAWLGGNNYNT